MTHSRTLLKGWKVLVIEDEPDNLEVAERILKFHGAIVVTAINGKDGLALAKIERPQFIISDLSMPVLDGWGLIYELKQDQTLMDIPVIALTAHAMIGDRERAINAGFHNYLTKPLTAKTFMMQLLSLLVEIPMFTEALATAQ